MLVHSLIVHPLRNADLHEDIDGHYTGGWSWRSWTVAMEIGSKWRMMPMLSQKQEALEF